MNVKYLQLNVVPLGAIELAIENVAVNTIKKK